MYCKDIYICREIDRHWGEPELKCSSDVVAASTDRALHEALKGSRLFLGRHVRPSVPSRGTVTEQAKLQKGPLEVNCKL